MSTGAIRPAALHPAWCLVCIAAAWAGIGQGALANTGQAESAARGGLIARVIQAAEQALRQAIPPHLQAVDLDGATIAPAIDDTEPDDPGLRTVVREPAVGSAAAYQELWVDLFRGQHWLRVVRVRLAVHSVQMAWLAVQDMTSGARLEPQLLRRGLWRVPGFAPAVWSGQPQGQRLQRTVLAGHPIMASAVMPAMAVDIGDRVALEHGHGALEIRTTATALTAGNPGQTVSVQPSGSQQVLSATVLEAGRVALRP